MIDKSPKYTKKLKKLVLAQFIIMLIFLAVFLIINFKNRNHIYSNKDLIIETILIIIVFVLCALTVLYIQFKISDKNKSIYKLTELKDKLNNEIEYRKNLEQALREQYKDLEQRERTYKLVLEGANDAIWEWNIKTNQIKISDKWTSISGYDSSNKSYDEYENIIHKKDIIKIASDYKNYITKKSLFFQSEFRIKTKDGQYKWMYVRGKALRNKDGKPLKLAGSLTDITERKNIEAEIMHMAYHDSLTNLPNRTFFTNKLKSIIEESKINQKKFAIIFLDLDDFKKVNDTLGHDYGDQLLKIVSNIFVISAEGKDNVARIGGDEFIILLPNIKDKNDVINVCNNITNIFKNPLEIGDIHMYISVSMGITIFPDDGTEASVLFKNADTAMYNSKEGNQECCFFDKSMSEEIIRRAQIERNLREALDKNEFKIYYQPQVETKTGCIKGLEALLRWDNEELGRVSPEEFIPVAEETELIIPIGEWVIREVCKKNKEWKNKGYEYEKIAINVSFIQLQYEYFKYSVLNIISETQINPKTIEFEITESVLVKCSNKVINLISDFKDLGINIALDDFGTGYSSLNHLKLLPIDTLKIDKFFIDNIHINNNDRAILEGIVGLAHNINLTVVVEGVEIIEQFNLAKNMFCDQIQGYYFCRPIPEEEVENLLVKGIIKV